MLTALYNIMHIQMVHYVILNKTTKRYYNKYIMKNAKTINYLEKLDLHE